MRSEIKLDKVDLVWAETFKAKPTGNDSVFITYTNTIYFVVIRLNKSGYIINQWWGCEKHSVSFIAQKLGITKQFIEVGKFLLKIKS